MNRRLIDDPSSARGKRNPINLAASMANNEEEEERFFLSHGERSADEFSRCVSPEGFIRMCDCSGGVRSGDLGGQSKKLNLSIQC